MSRFFIVVNSMKMGGAERVASMLADYASGNRLKPIILCTDSRECGYELPNDAIVRLLPLARLSRTPFFIVAIVIQSFYLAYLLRNERFVVSFLHRANIVNCFSGFLSGRRVIVSERSIFSKSYFGLKSKVLQVLLSFSYRVPDAIIAISSIVRDSLVLDLGVEESKITVIYNPIDLLRFNLDGRECNQRFSSDRPLNFCSVSRLEPLKRIDLAVNIFHEMTRYFPGAVLSIFGEGPQKCVISKRISDLGLKQLVKLEGNSSNIHICLKQKNVLIISSTHESFGNVALEAIASGLIVLYSSNLAVCREIFFGTSCLAFEFDESDLEKASFEAFNFLTSLSSERYLEERLEFLDRFKSSRVFEEYFKVIIS